MTLRHTPRHRRLSMLGWCVAVLSTQWVFADNAPPTPPSPPTLDASYQSGSDVIFVGENLSKGLYEIVVEVKGDKIGTGIFLAGPGTATVRVNRIVGTLKLAPNNRVWLRPTNGGALIGDGTFDSRGRRNPCTIRDDRAFYDWFSQALPSSEQPVTVMLQQPLVIASVSPRMGGALQEYRAYDAGTTITFSLDPAEASWCDEEVDVQGTGAVVSVGEHDLQYTITEDWYLESDHNVEVAGLGVHVNPGTPWIHVQTVEVGRSDTILTDAAHSVVHTSVGAPGTSIVSNETLRVAGVPNRGDTNGDRLVDVEDLLQVLYRYGKHAEGSEADTDLDGTVGILDLLDVLGNWRRTAAA
jgi:hypothetical protein